MIDASAVARVVGIETKFVDRRAGGILFLGQRIAVLAQGESGVSFPSTKWEAPSAGEAGARFGFKSAIYQIMKMLKPANGDGVGTIPVTIYPLGDHGSGAAAVGDITPSGTPTAARSYRVRVAGILGDAFTIAAGAISGAALTSACGKIGDSINAILGMPVFVGYTYGTVTASALVGTGNGTLTSLAVTSGASPRPGAWTLTLNTVVANGGVWTLTDPAGTVISNTVTMTPGAGTATPLSVGGLDFTLTDGSTDFGLGATFTITVPATNVKVTAGWKGLTGNLIKLEVIGDSAEVSFAFTQPAGGLNNPDVQPALDQFGNVWETMVLNQFGTDDTTTLDKIKDFGDGRWGQTVKKPFVSFTGSVKTTVADATAVTSVRRTDKINSQLPAPGSVNLPFVVAARQLARIAVVANNNPPVGYAAQQVTQILPGADSVQWDYPKRDAAIKAGSSTTEVVDQVVQISDVVTFYRPTGEEPPAYRHVRNIVKLQNIIYNLELIFAQKSWASAPLVPDEQAVVNPAAKKPMQAKAAVGAMLESLGEQAILSDPATAKKNTTAVINSQNPDRLDVKVPVQLSGNTDIISVDLEFGFYFGQALAA